MTCIAEPAPGGSRGAPPRGDTVVGSGDDQGQDVPLDEVARAIADVAAGRPVLVVDDADRENEGDLVFAASKATPDLLTFMIRYARGLICVPMLGPDLDRLHLPQMTSQNQEHHGTAFTISVDAVPWCSWFWLVICGTESRSRSAPSIGTQIRPLA